MNWIDIKQQPPDHCGDIIVKCTDGREVLTHANVCYEGKHKLSKYFIERLHNSGEFTIINDNDITCSYVYYSNIKLGVPIDGAVHVFAKDIVSYKYVESE